MLLRAGTLYDAALTLPRRGELRGRGLAPVVELAGETCVVRHYQRGGAVASVLGDRYLRAAGNRVVNELRVSEIARNRGVMTPRVKCAAWYTEGLFERYDIATEFIPRSRDLSFLLFGDAPPPDSVLTNTAALVRSMLGAGLIHRDLNVKNIIVDDNRAHILDLDRCYVRDRVTESDARKMRDRFFRSLNKWETKTGRRVHDVARDVLSQGFHV